MLMGQCFEFGSIIDLPPGSGSTIEPCRATSLGLAQVFEVFYDPKSDKTESFLEHFSYAVCAAVLRIRTFLSDPDPEISAPNPDPDPALVVFKKIYVSVQYRAYVYLFTP
jgi:hypothetical protein